MYRHFYALSNHPSSNTMYAWVENWLIFHLAYSWGRFGAQLEKVTEHLGAFYLKPIPISFEPEFAKGSDQKFYLAYSR